MQRQQMEAQALKLIGAYSTIYYHDLNQQGMRPERDEIAGELGVAAAWALKCWLPEDQQPDDVKTSFSTYCIRCFNAAIYNYAEAIIKDTLAKRAAFHGGAMDRVTDESTPDEAGVLWRIAMREVIDQLTGIDKIIVQEAINPSHAVRMAITNNGGPGRRMTLWRAIAKVHGLTDDAMKYRLKRIKSSEAVKNIVDYN